jgi:ferredoxin
MQLHKLVEEALPELDTMIGWAAGEDPLHTRPIFIRSAESIPRLIWSPFCAQNLTGYLVKPPALQPADKNKQIGICVKGCDSRSLVALIQEKFVTRDRLRIFGIPCRGTVDWRKVMRQVRLSYVKSARVEDNRLIVDDAGGSHNFDLEDVLTRKCLRCIHPNPVVYDVMVGEPTVSRIKPEDLYRDVDALEKRPLEERLAFWQAELDRCMRCYACRNACPLCVCQERCIAETRDPKWLTQRMGIPEKFLFHFIHAMHLAGRCTECGECERVCPMEIPVTLMKEKLNKIMEEMLGYVAGLDPTAIPPLLTFNPGETGV